MRKLCAWKRVSALTAVIYGDYPQSKCIHSSTGAKILLVIHAIIHNFQFTQQRGSMPFPIKRTKKIASEDPVVAERPPIQGDAQRQIDTDNKVQHVLGHIVELAGTAPSPIVQFRNQSARASLDTQTVRRRLSKKRQGSRSEARQDQHPCIDHSKSTERPCPDDIDSRQDTSLHEFSQDMEPLEFCDFSIPANLIPDPQFRMDYKSNSPLTIGKGQSMSEMSILLRLLLIRSSLIQLMHGFHTIDSLMTNRVLSPQDKNRLLEVPAIIQTLLMSAIESSQVAIFRNRMSCGSGVEFLEKPTHEARRILQNGDREWNAWVRQPSGQS